MQTLQRNLVLGLGLAEIAAIACFRRATAGTRPRSCCAVKHSVRAFHPNTHTRSLSVLSATERRLAFAGCDNGVVGRRPEDHHEVCTHGGLLVPANRF